MFSLGKVINIIYSIMDFLKKIEKILDKMKEILFKNEEIRVSAAYLFRIKIENKYLLVKGNKISQYQPIGGVYKYKNSFKSKMNEWEAREEETENFYEKNDIRIIIKRKYISEFKKWFNSKKNRECDYKREFEEEIIKKDILPENVKINFDFIRTIDLGIKYSKHFERKELKIFDIIQIELDKESENKILEYLKRSDYLCLAKGNEIKKETFDLLNKTEKISEHSKYIL